VISVCVPTRNRPGNVERLVVSAVANAAGPVQFVLRVDDDAPGSVPPHLPANVAVVTGPRELLSKLWNQCLPQAQGDILMVCGDDVMFHTPRWDRAVREAIERHGDRIAVAYGNDLIHGQNLATHPFVHRRWVDTLGYLTPPLFAGDYVDTWVHDLAARLGRLEYLPGVVIEHLHPNVGKARRDPVYDERMARQYAENSAAIWENTVDERVRDARKLQALLGTPCG
jgi:Glycosyl transferase family 2